MKTKVPTLPKIDRLIDLVESIGKTAFDLRLARELYSIDREKYAGKLEIIKEREKLITELWNQVAELTSPSPKK